MNFILANRRGDRMPLRRGQKQQQQQHLYSPSTHADKVKKNNISVCTQLNLELK